MAADTVPTVTYESPGLTRSSGCNAARSAADGPVTASASMSVARGSPAESRRRSDSGWTTSIRVTTGRRSCVRVSGVPKLAASMVVPGSGSRSVSDSFQPARVYSSNAVARRCRNSSARSSSFEGSETTYIGSSSSLMRPCSGKALSKWWMRLPRFESMPRNTWPKRSTRSLTGWVRRSHPAETRSSSPPVGTSQEVRMSSTATHAPAWSTSSDSNCGSAARWPSQRATVRSSWRRVKSRIAANRNRMNAIEG